MGSRLRLPYLTSEEEGEDREAVVTSKESYGKPDVDYFCCLMNLYSFFEFDFFIKLINALSTHIIKSTLFPSIQW